MTYDKIVSLLLAAGIRDAAHEAALLIGHFCNAGPAEIPLLRGRELDCPNLEQAVNLRTGRYPLQYILGKWGFCSESYLLSTDCLIPRPDTELLVETAAELIVPGGRFIDAGTGSGCIAISLLAARGDITGVAFDISEGAIKTAEKNAELNSVADRLTIYRGDMLDEQLWRSAGLFDAVISNPPYIPTDERHLLEPELAHEPRRALDGGADGLDFYRAIIKNATLALAPGGVLILEVGYRQAASVVSLAGLGGYGARILKDIEGRERALVLHRAQAEAHTQEPANTIN